MLQFLVIVIALCIVPGTSWRGNNSPASTMLPAGDYTSELEDLFRMDSLFREMDSLVQRESFARALLLVCPLELGEKIKLNFREYALTQVVKEQLSNLLGVMVERDCDNSEEDNNRWVFKKIQDTPCKYFELLFHEISHGSTRGRENGLYGTASPTVPKETSARAASTEMENGANDVEEEVVQRNLLKRAFEDIQQGKRSRSIMTRAQRVFAVYKKEYQRFPKMKVRLFRGYNTRERIGTDREVSLLSTLGDALRDVDEEAWCQVQEGSQLLCCLRDAQLSALDPACTFLQAELRPPGVNLYLLGASEKERQRH